MKVSALRICNELNHAKIAFNGKHNFSYLAVNE